MFFNIKISRLVVVILFLIILVVIYKNIYIGPQNPLDLTCIPKDTYLCAAPFLHQTIFSFEVAQMTGTVWKNVSLLWVPLNQSQTFTTAFCPSQKSNTISGGISCATPNGIYLNETLKYENITFSEPVTVGSTYTGQILAEYQDNSGAWHTVQLTSKVEIKAV